MTFAMKNDLTATLVSNVSELRTAADPFKGVSRGSCRRLLHWVHVHLIARPDDAEWVDLTDPRYTHLPNRMWRRHGALLQCRVQMSEKGKR